MGRGKKKGQKDSSNPEGLVKALETVSLDVSDQPSTSSAPPEEEFEGMTGGARKKKPTKKKDSEQVKEEQSTPDIKPPVAEASVEKVTSTEKEVTKEEDEDEGGLGLGLGGKKRQRKRKPKADKSESQAAAQQPSEAAVKPSPPAQEERTPVAEVPQPVAVTPQQSKWAAPPSVQPPPQRSGYPGVQTTAPSQPGSSWRRQDPPQQAVPPQSASPREQPRAEAQSIPQQGCSDSIPAKIHGNKVPARITKVYTNYLPMTIKPLKIHRYDVGFNPERPKKLLPLAFKTMMKTFYPKYLTAFDQMKNVYVVEPLPGVTETSRTMHKVEIFDNNGRQISFEVSLKFTGIVDLDTLLQYMKCGTSESPPTEAIHCVDVVLKQGTLQDYVKAGRTFFMRPQRPIDLGDGLEMWTGLFQSAIFTSKPYINIDVAHKGFPIQQSMLDVLKMFGFNPNSDLESQRGNIDRLKAFLKGLRLVAPIGGDVSKKGQWREYICNDIMEPAIKLRFGFTEQATGVVKQMTVAEYFTKEKNCRLRYPYLNCLWVGPRDKTIFYPMELLEVSYGQVLNRQLNEQQLSKMVCQAATPPKIRKAKIDEVISKMDYSRNIYFKKFGLEIKEEFTEVPAKVIQPPILQYTGGTVQPRNGQWQSRRMLQAANLRLWGFIAIGVDARAANVENAISMFKSCSQDMGMQFGEPTIVRCNLEPKDVEGVMLEAIRQQLQLMFVVVPTRGPKNAYSQVKKIAERRVGLLTQCIKEQTMQQRFNVQTVRNILLKVNSKLMGVNQALDNRCMPLCLKDGGVMVVGADVTHPSPDQSNIPSIAAVTASIDTKCFQYNIGLSIQTPKKEMIVEFEDMMLEHLKIYRERQRVLPKKIYVFRDGVSEGQFKQVRKSELKAIYEAYRTLDGGKYKPEVLFLLVQKRHHTRLFTDLKSPENVEPGTVVDTDIVHARELDFYLVSHQAIKGTARPTRYHAICNDGKLPSDEVEQLAYYLCHLYSRCSRSVSYPTPTYYAHLACLRARVLTMGEKFDNNDLEKQPKRLRVLDKMLTNSRMFFV